MFRQLIGAAFLPWIATGVIAQTYATGDPRNVTTQTYPAVCQTLPAQFSTASRSSPPSSDDTTRIQNALNSCAGTGHSVVLAASGSNNAFGEADSQR
jgi:polygalacturonase